MLAEVEDGAFSSFEKVALSSLHTTAGFLEQSLCSTLDNSSDRIQSLIRSAHRLFPEGAPYWHDQMELRSELTPEQRKSEPLNADSHLTFICLGMCSSVLYEFRPTNPIFFIDLDGEFQGTFRSRKIHAIGYNHSECVHEERFSVSMPDEDRHALDLSQYLRDVQSLVVKHKIHRGVVSFELETEENHAGITVNEFENLLVQRDITDVLLNPLRYMLDSAPELARHPERLPRKAKKMLTYELHLAIRDCLRLAGRGASVIEHMAGRLGVNLPLLENIIDRLATPLEARWMNLGSTIRFLINADEDQEYGHVSIGTYQSPILIQWRKPNSLERVLCVRLLRLE